jgi:hypothetical protein
VVEMRENARRLFKGRSMSVILPYTSKISSTWIAVTFLVSLPMRMVSDEAGETERELQKDGKSACGEQVRTGRRGVQRARHASSWRRRTRHGLKGLYTRGGGGGEVGKRWRAW